MRILLCSHLFHPSVGGTEQVSQVLAQEFSLTGHTVKVVTSTAESDGTIFLFEVIRRPSPLKFLTLVLWSEVVFHNNISLRLYWPLAMIRRPWVVAHHTWIARTDGSIGLQDRLKQFAIRFARNIAVSRPVADHLHAPAVVIGNPYRDDLFHRESSGVRERDLIFLGRLVRDKGVDILLDALRLLREQNFLPGLMIVGNGPELADLQEMVEKFQLVQQVVFVGTQTGPALVELLNQHRIIVVPSRCQETFGLAALEGVACGCRAIVARVGGLVEAIGGLAVMFERGNPVSLARAIERTLTEQFDWETYWQLTDERLHRFAARSVAGKYLDVLAEAVREKGLRTRVK
jgi:glycosyltransferase involved in cell wall biosynthesis